jgi:hypothetical protein
MAAMLAATLTVGCTKLDPSEQTVFDRPETEQIIVIAMDLSGSFADLMTKDGLAYRFVLATVDRYLRENSGGDGRLVIAQLSATGNPLLWEGKPSDLRRHFGSADSFREFLLSKSDPRGSRINEGVANALDYTINHASVRSNGAKPALFVLSDMMDNDPAGADHMKRVNELLGDFADVGGVIGLYYVNQSMLIDWRTRIESSGVRDSRIECGIVSNPDLPVFF